MTPFNHFQTITQVWIHIWRWNEARFCLEEVPYCFSRSSVKLQGHTAKKNVDFDPIWAFTDCNSSSNSPMAMKWCIKLDVVQERCPIVFQGHPSNFKVTWDKKIATFYPNWAFPDCNSSLNIPMALKCCTKLNVVQKRCPRVIPWYIVLGTTFVNVSLSNYFECDILANFNPVFKKI